MHISNQVSFLIGPLVYLYVNSRLNCNYKITIRDLIHGIPFVSVIIYLIVKFYFLTPSGTPVFNYKLIGILAFAHSFAYLILAFRNIKSNKSFEHNIFKLQGENPVVLMYFFIMVCFFLWTTKFLLFTAWDEYGYFKIRSTIANLFFLVSFIFFNMFLYICLTKPHHFLSIKKYQQSSLSSKKKQEYTLRLISLMEKEKVYLNPSLNLNSLAKTIGASEKLVSQIINESFNLSFYDYINTLRIKKVMSMLSNASNNDKTILFIAYEVGFNSKSTFNAAFRKHANIPPSEYRKKSIDKILRK